MDRITPEDIQVLPKGFIFVFGSNESGIHMSGAAKFAKEKCGAIYGQGYGFMVESFAIPTKDWDIRTLPLEKIEHYVEGFIRFTRRAHDNWKYYVTKIGCGLAGLTPEQIAPMFSSVRDQANIWLPQEFIDIIDTIKYDAIANESYAAGRDS